MSESKYFAKDEQYQNELNRLRLQETVFDPMSFRRFETIGIKQGWKCLEVGAGTGSVAEWLSKKVGPTGKVTATDIHPRFLQDLKVPNLEVRQHDILKDHLETNAYDLVHCRAVLMHLQEPDEAFQRMIGAARRGGWVFVEDSDGGSILSNDITDPAAAPFVATMRAIFDAPIKNRAMDCYFGRRLLRMAEQTGLADINQDGTTRVAHGGDAESMVLARNLEISSKRLVGLGTITQKKVDEAVRFLNDPNSTYWGFTFFGVWGRKANG